MKTPEEIEKLADEKYLEKAKRIDDSTIMGFIVSAVKGGFVEGYQQCQEDNKDKKYTEEDMMKAFEYGKTLQPFDCFEDFIKSLNKQD